jgi:uncharacterized protein
MKRVDGQLRIAATDLSQFAACPHATLQSLGVADGKRAKPPSYPDTSAKLLQERGHEHEAAYLASLRQTRDVEIVPMDLSSTQGAALTLDAMKRGVPVIYQGTLAIDARWHGRPDFLVRVEKRSTLGAWSYEPADAKLARSPKAGALLQMCFYAELLRHAQGTLPDGMTLVLGDMREERFLTARYAAYFRLIRQRFEQLVAAPPVTYPEPVEHCDVCDYADECDARRRADDHLSLVAGITRSQRRALEMRGVSQRRQLVKLPLSPPVEGIGGAAFTRIHEQARIQEEGEGTSTILHELLLPTEPGRGLQMLPEPSAGDLFLDLEGDPYVLGDGLEYLFGVVEIAPEGEPRYTPFWAFDRAGEKLAFEALMALIARRRAQHPEMHVYHYNHYEPTALKRLACRHATCVDELDELLRAEAFVDLYRAVRQGLRASVESYSLKKIEPMFGFRRSVPLRDANRCLAAFEAWMESRDAELPREELRRAIEGYNRDDCLSAMQLRAWLEDRRKEMQQQGHLLTRPEPVDGAPDEDLAEHLARVRAVSSALLEGVPDEPAERTAEQSARYVLAHLLEWHRREDKSSYWEYFRLCERTDDELQEEGSALGGVTYEGPVGNVDRSVIHRYRFPPQDHALDRALSIDDPRTRKSAGELVAVDDEQCFIDLKRGTRNQAPHPTALIPGRPLGNKEQRESLLRLGEHVVANGFERTPAFAAALSLLRREPPRPSSEGSTTDETAVLRALAVDGSVLPVQGPPGTGKTHDGARMIVALLRAGKRVGIVAHSHKVITNLLDEACRAAREQGVSLTAIQKNDTEDGSQDPLVRTAKDNAEVVRALQQREANVVAGTAWLWSRADMIGAVDVLFVDEAGQMSLANVLAAAPASNGLVLLGDPQQLDQPLKGVHPPGVAVSSLGHVLDGHATMDPSKGLFLEHTWRMHPDVCDYISEVFYEGRLKPRSDLARIALHAAGDLAGTGLRYVPVDHHGNQSASPEEVDVVERLVSRLLGGGVTWTDRHGHVRDLAATDILVVAPYNAHVALLRRRLPHVRVGTVDKFQGQQAPVVIYSMATSSPDLAPRGPEFLFSGNRLDVAISRARCAAFLVASPTLLELTCKTERQMALVNAFCRYLEVAREVRV